MAASSARYLKRFFDEKAVDRDETFQFERAGEWHLMPYGVVIDAILGCGSDEQNKIAGTLRRIDFVNGDVKHFLRHLGRGLAAGVSA